MMYVYTEKAERRAQELGLETRKAGKTAYCGTAPLMQGLKAQEWLKAGLIKKVAESRE